MGIPFLPRTVLLLMWRCFTFLERRVFLCVLQNVTPMNRCNVSSKYCPLKTDQSKSVQVMGRSRLINCGVTFDLAALSALCRHFRCSSSGSHHIRRPLHRTSCLALYNVHAPLLATVGGFARTWILDASVCPWVSPRVDCAFAFLRPQVRNV